MSSVQSGSRRWAWNRELSTVLAPRKPATPREGGVAFLHSLWELRQPCPQEGAAQRTKFMAFQKVVRKDFMEEVAFELSCRDSRLGRQIWGRKSSPVEKQMTNRKGPEQLWVWVGSCSGGPV